MYNKLDKIISIELTYKFFWLPKKLYTTNNKYLTTNTKWIWLQWAVVRKDRRLFYLIEVISKNCENLIEEYEYYSKDAAEYLMYYNIETGRSFVPLPRN